MKFLIIILILILISVIIAIFYYNAYSNLNDIRIKIDNANKNIMEKLDKKYELMKLLHTQIKKVLKKKDYFKDFNSLKEKNLSSYELDSELANNLETMKNLKEDYKQLNTDDYNNILLQIKEIDQEITANKKYFNKNNNKLMKSLRGYHKIVAKIHNINVKTSYEIKEPID